MLVRVVKETLPPAHINKRPKKINEKMKIEESNSEVASIFSTGDPSVRLLLALITPGWHS